MRARTRTHTPSLQDKSCLQCRTRAQPGGGGGGVRLRAGQRQKIRQMRAQKRLRKIYAGGAIGGANTQAAAAEVQRTECSVQQHLAEAALA
jgi:hypothetical protein